MSFSVRGFLAICICAVVLAAALHFRADDASETGIERSDQLSALREKGRSRREAGKNATSRAEEAGVVNAKSDSFPAGEGTNGAPLPDSLRLLANQSRNSVDPFRRVRGEALELAWTDMTAAVELLRRSLPPEQRESAICNLVWLVASHRLEAFHEGLTFISDPRLRSQASSIVVNNWSQKDPLHLLRYASEKLNGELRNSAYRAAIGPLSQKGLYREAAGAVFEMPQSHARKSAVRTLAFNWGRQDAEAAFGWFDQLGDAEDRKIALQQILNANTNMPVDNLVERANASANDSEKEIYVSAAFKRVADSDLKAATAWVETLPPSLRPPLQKSIATKVAEKNLNEGISYALRISDESQKAWAIDAITRNATAKDPPAATALLQQLPEKLQERAAGSLVSRWYRIDSTQATRWAETLPIGSVRDSALMTLSSQMLTSDPETARRLIEQISDPRRRDALLKTTP